jgi:apolipoprotein N-acyltransferase
MDVQGHGVGTLICFEIAYDDLVVDAVRGGSQVIVVQSNNALFGDSDEAIQQLAEARVMGVISGRSVVHVSTVGHSGIYSPDGRQLDFQEHWTQGAVVADVPLRTGITPAVAAGDWIAVGLSALGLAGLAVALSRRSRAIARTAPRTSRSDRSSRSSRSS